MTEAEALRELMEARRIMCSTRDGERMLERVIPALGWLLFNVPEKFVTSVHAAIYEAERRSAYLPWRADRKEPRT